MSLAASIAREAPLWMPPTRPLMRFPAAEPALSLNQSLTPWMALPARFWAAPVILLTLFLIPLASLLTKVDPGVPPFPENQSFTPWTVCRARDSPFSTTEPIPFPILVRVPLIKFPAVELELDPNQDLIPLTTLDPRFLALSTTELTPFPMLVMVPLMKLPADVFEMLANQDLMPFTTFVPRLLALFTTEVTPLPMLVINPLMKFLAVSVLPAKKFLTPSTSPRANSTPLETTDPIPFAIPLMMPNGMLMARSIKTCEGEWIPRNSLKPFTSSSAIALALSQSVVAKDPMALIMPSTMAETRFAPASPRGPDWSRMVLATPLTNWTTRLTAAWITGSRFAASASTNSVMMSRTRSVTW